MSPIVICIALFVVMLVLFFTNKIPMSFTALAAMVALVLFGCLDSSAAIATFGSNTVITMASMFVVAAGLTRTQMINNVTRLLYKVTEGSFTKVLASYVVITCIIGQFVPSIVAIFALVHPLVQNMCDRMNISPSKMMYPIAIAAVSTSFIIEPIGPYGRLVCDAERVHGVLWVDLYPAEHVERDGGLPAGGDRHYPAGHFCCSSLPPRSAGAAHYGHRRRKLQEQAPLSPVREFLGYGVFVAVILGLMLGYTSWQVTLIGAIVLVASGVLTEREAIENMNMSTVLLYVGVSAFGTGSGPDRCRRNAGRCVLQDAGWDYQRLYCRLHFLCGGLPDDLPAVQPGREHGADPPGGHYMQFYRL